MHGLDSGVCFCYIIACRYVMCIVHAGYNNPNQIHTWTSLVDVIEIPQPHCAEIGNICVFLYFLGVENNRMENCTRGDKS